MKLEDIVNSIVSKIEKIKAFGRYSLNFGDFEIHADGLEYTVYEKPHFMDVCGNRIHSHCIDGVSLKIHGRATQEFYKHFVHKLDLYRKDDVVIKPLGFVLRGAFISHYEFIHEDFVSFNDGTIRYSIEIHADHIE